MLQLSTLATTPRENPYAAEFWDDKSLIYDWFYVFVYSYLGHPVKVKLTNIMMVGEISLLRIVQ